MLRSRQHSTIDTTAPSAGTTRDGPTAASGGGRRRRAWVFVAVALVLATGAGLGGAAAFGGTSTRGRTVVVATEGCAPGWQAPAHPGAATFSLRNDTTQPEDLQLIGAAKGLVYGEVPVLGPHTVLPLSLVLEPGIYVWHCQARDGEVTVSQDRTIGGKPVPGGAPGFVPITADDLTGAALEYRADTTLGLAALQRDTVTLHHAVDAEKLGQARADWLVAHLDYERLGAAYGTFGPFDTLIDGRPDGLLGGVTNPRFTGFLRLEYGLWHGQSWPVLAAVSAQLATNVSGLVAAFPYQLLPVTDIPLRAHEILENALQFQLTGDADEGSHTELATVDANVAGTETVIDVLAPLIEQRRPALLQEAREQLASLATLLGPYQIAPGRWVPLQSLTQMQREALDAATDAALAVLDQIPPAFEIQAGGDT